ncbi:hypothetical protein A2Z00_03705 [Candidatus Gottesmanbacteria bacterium RBG_13_45_10]|uniref:Uncharacterized protein n=1 Tax=Candidatus Gottesmanbacteria bacterium RBG_13_45_10 TaxID=1798370 RepID=A0A1F5ZFX3_9BACT|nr:MAG: hypothetical protein A2Z00_03705 [Candidatus Gottesmanbacteria bacterium RBG_13_45_10]
MHAYIITGGLAQERQKHITKMLYEWQIALPDTVILELVGSAIGIAEIRGFQKRLILKPYASPYTVGIVHHIDLLTPEAQNALLKTLEEPPPHTRIIGETDRIHALLPTIISRCDIITLKSEELFSQDALKEMQGILQKLLKQSPGARLQTLEAFEKTRDDAKAWVVLALAATRAMLLSSYTNVDTHTDRRTLTVLIRKLLIAQKQLYANVSPKLVLDHVFLP